MPGQSPGAAESVKTPNPKRLLPREGLTCSLDPFSPTFQMRFLRAFGQTGQRKEKRKEMTFIVPAPQRKTDGTLEIREFKGSLFTRKYSQRSRWGIAPCNPGVAAVDLLLPQD